MTIPKTPCPVGGLVPWMGGVWPIIARKAHPVLLWLYSLDQKQPDRPRCFHYNISQEDVVKEMDLFAKFKVGDSVQIGSFNVRRILSRKWDFQGGTMKYEVEGGREGRGWVMEQAELERRIKAATEEHA